MTIVLVTVAVMAMALLLGLSNAPKNKSVSVKVEDNSTVRVERNGNEVTLKVEYIMAKDKSSDDELFPDIVNIPPANDDESSCGGSFWQKVARMREPGGLPSDEKQRIMSTLRLYGFIYDPDVCMATLEGGTQDSAEDGDVENVDDAEETEEAGETCSGNDDDAMEPVETDDDPFMRPFVY